MTRINTWMLLLAGLAVSVTAESATLTSVEVAENSVTFNSDAAIERVEHFVMTDPLRLVVDLYGVALNRPQPAVALTGGFRQLRSGAHPDKTRLVFDAAGTELPPFSVDRASRHVKINWQGLPVQAGARPQPAAGDDRARVTLIDIIDVQDGASSQMAGSGPLAPIAKIWRYQVRIAVRPFSKLNEVKHYLLRRPDRLVLELVGALPGDHGRSFQLHNGFSRLDIDSTRQSVRLFFEMGDGPLPGFDIIEAASEERIVVAWGALGDGSGPPAAGTAE